jgi:hypothetical protein
LSKQLDEHVRHRHDGLESARGGAERVGTVGNAQLDHESLTDDSRLGILSDAGLNNIPIFI